STAVPRLQAFRASGASPLAGEAADPSGDRAEAVRARGRGGVDEADLGRALDGGTAVRDAQLAIHGDRLRLDRIAGDEQTLADLAERQVGGEQREQSQLGCRQPRSGE